MIGLLVLLPAGGHAQRSGQPSAHDAAVRIAGLGPRPAASSAEQRAHELVARSFRRTGLRVSLQRFAVPRHGRSRNVIGVIDAPARCLHVVMAHADTTPAGPGANDNASGVGVLMAVARRLSRASVRCDVWLVATGAEERVYTGSRDHLGALALARHLRRSGRSRRVRLGLSLDEVGRGRSFWLRSPAPGPRRNVERKLLAVGRRAGMQISWVRDSGTGNSDHRELELLGMPAAKLGVGSGGEPCRHLACDRPSRLQPRSLRLVERVVASLLRVTRR